MNWYFNLIPQNLNFDVLIYYQMSVDLKFKYVRHYIFASKKTLFFRVFLFLSDKLADKKQVGKAHKILIHLPLWLYLSILHHDAQLSKYAE